MIAPYAANPPAVRNHLRASRGIGDRRRIRMMDTHFGAIADSETGLKATQQVIGAFARTPGGSGSGTKAHIEFADGRYNGAAQEYCVFDCLLPNAARCNKSCLRWPS